MKEYTNIIWIHNSKLIWYDVLILIGTLNIWTKYTPYLAINRPTPNQIKKGNNSSLNIIFDVSSISV